MKKEDFDKEIMDYLEGKNVNPSNPKAKEAATSLRPLHRSLQDLPAPDIDTNTNDRFASWLANLEIQDKKGQGSSVKKFRKWWPVTAVAAALILLIFLSPSKGALEKQYSGLASNPEKLSFIYNLNKEQLQQADIIWLEAQLKKEEHPNIRVTIVDLLNNYPTQLDDRYFDHLLKEPVPTVQMALLDAFERLENRVFSSQLLVFSQRSDLEQTVRLKAEKILSNY